MTPNELRQGITAQIVEALKSGGTPFWKRPWTNDPNCGAPVNIITGRQYKGMNPLLLTLSGMKNGFTSRYWASYKQWQALGGQVRRGSKGTAIVFYKAVERPGQDGETERFYVLRYWNVFNLDQVDGERLDRFRPGVAAPESLPPVDWTAADEVIKATGADIRYGGNEAFFSPAGNFIQIPARIQFPDLRDFYDVHWHELGHWSMAPARLNIVDTYAFGELVAELTAAFIPWQLSLPQSQDLTNHKAYLASWLMGMGNDPKWVFHAAAAAGKAADYILGFSQKVEAESEAEAA